EVNDSAEMILMGVREQETGDIVPLLLDETDVWEDKVDAGLVLGAESDAHVDDQPLARAGPAITVEVEIHDDLAHAAEREEDELGPLTVLFWSHVGVSPPHRLEKKTSPAKMRCSAPSGVKNLSAPSASRPP